MDTLFEPVIEEEIESIRSHFKTKATALKEKIGKRWRWSWCNFDITKYSKISINEKTYFIAATNVFSAVINKVLIKAIELYPENFGNDDPMKVLKAVYDSEPWGPFNSFDNFLSDEQFAFIFEVDKESVVSEKVLRVDLFRLINTNYSIGRKPEFTGGVFHSFKHFSYNGKPLSTGKGEVSIDHPGLLINIAIMSFFQSTIKRTKKGFNSVIELPNLGKIKGSFFEESNTNVYFINTLHPC